MYSHRSDPYREGGVPYHCGELYSACDIIDISGVLSGSWKSVYKQYAYGDKNGIFICAARVCILKNRAKLLLADVSGYGYYYDDCRIFAVPPFPKIHQKFIEFALFQQISCAIICNNLEDIELRHKKC